jgi:hypothetical protein
MSLAGVLNREQPKEKAQMIYAQMDARLSLLRVGMEDRTAIWGYIPGGR